MGSGPEWKLHWYQNAFGFGQVRFATVWSNKAVPSLMLGEDKFDLVTGSQEIALKQHVAQLGVGSMTLAGKPEQDDESI